VLKGILSAEAYDHFMQLSLAVVLFSCKKYVQNEKLRSLGAKLMICYVEKFKELYGDDSISYNAHNLVHVILDVEEYGALQEISAYPFESTLYRIKRLLKSKFLHFYSHNNLSRLHSMFF